MVAAGCATAAAILGYQVLRRSRSARLALTLLAVPLFVTGLVTGGFTSSVVAASAVMLWFQPARDWFNGVVREPRPEVANRVAPPAAPPYDGTRPGPGPARVRGPAPARVVSSAARRPARRYRCPRRPTRRCGRRRSSGRAC